MTSGKTELLRFSTAGSVDDGKSTLIGRLLYDAKSVFEDQLTAAAHSTQKRGREGVDLALLTDGLIAEREQGITIDVAYRYFATLNRDFIIADTPGHEQYTRNMVTGASTADLALVLIDARKGVLPQSRRHYVIAALLGIPSVVVCVNKMDLVDYDEARFNEIETAFRAFSANLPVPHLEFLPVSALHGDNVVSSSGNMPWYGGRPLLSLLETVTIEVPARVGSLRFPVQWVNRPNADLRSYCGVIARGAARPGMEVIVQPSGIKTRVLSVATFDGALMEAFSPLSVAITLEDNIDVSRGDVIAAADDPATVTNEFVADVCWMAEAPLKPLSRYLIKHGTRTVKAVVSAIKNRLDVESLVRSPSETLALNAIGEVAFKLQSQLAYDAYRDSRATGSFIIIDEATNNTVGAGMIS